jgi:hypothetical protein
LSYRRLLTAVMACVPVAGRWVKLPCHLSLWT